MKKIAERIRSKIDNGTKFWKVTRRIGQKTTKSSNKISDQK